MALGEPALGDFPSGGAVDDWNDQVRRAWEDNAAWWHETVGEGDRFHELLIYPAVEELLGTIKGETVLDVGCGNGNFARRLSRLGAHVHGIDFSEQLIKQARSSTPDADSLTFDVVDATNVDSLRKVRTHRFDAVVASMVLHDMADISLLLTTIGTALRPVTGRFVCALPHPCFNSTRVTWFEERSFGADWSRIQGVTVTSYLRPFVDHTRIKPSQPTPTPVFHRPLSLLVGMCCRAGLMLDAMVEPGPHSALEIPAAWMLQLDVPLFCITRWRPAPPAATVSDSY
jgi:2-polyprenyl-3-methyl-5-hydroxy-6-metoxy-1,4-benzoquinol methylase